MSRFSALLAPVGVALSIAASCVAMPQSAAASLQLPSLTPPVAQAARVVWAQAQAQYFWTLRGQSILAAFHTGGSAGQCTEIVASRRPDVISRVDTFAYSHDLLADPAAPVALVVNWRADAWAANARAAGIPTGQAPRPGAVMVFQPGAYGAGAAGHVALVDRVARNGSFTIREMHAPLLGVITLRRFGPRIAKSMARDPRVTFIYS